MQQQHNIEKIDASSEESVKKFLIDLWGDLLDDGEPIKGDSNFFEVGGDSLVALEVVVALEEHMDLELAVTDLYEYPTPAELAEYLVRL